MNKKPVHHTALMQTIKYPLRTAIGAFVVLVLAQTYCSFMTPWIALLFLLWVLGGSKLT
jgi:hypothetical protein